MPPVASAAVAEGIEVLARPCSIHDDRIRELENEQSAHQAQLAAGGEMFRSIQDSIKMLSEHVGESMNRVENTVNRVADDVRALQGQVSEIRIEQTAQKGQLSDLTKDHDQREADKKERSKELRGLIFKVLGVGAALVAASVAGAYGKTWLAAFFRALAGG